MQVQIMLSMKDNHLKIYNPQRSKTQIKTFCVFMQNSRASEMLMQSYFWHQMQRFLF